jgi:hypothetical protein
VLTRDLERDDWGGKGVAAADMELSCGDFNRGLDLIEIEMKRRTMHPYSSGEPADTFFAEAPYYALERAYRAIGRSDLADKAAVTRTRISSADDDGAVLADVLNDGANLLREGRTIPVK